MHTTWRYRRKQISNSPFNLNSLLTVLRRFYLVILVCFLIASVSLYRYVSWLNDPDRYRGNEKLGHPEFTHAINTTYDAPFQVGCGDPREAAKGPRASAAIVVLARNKELDGVVSSMRSFERHFNHWFNYPYVFLNDGDFNSTFKETVVQLTNGNVEFGKLDKSLWGFPDWADKEVFQEGIRKQGDQGIMYGEMESYHHMCRFYSGFFYQHHLLDKFKWYWRLEPDIKYFCDITYDPFVMMEKHKKTYSYTIVIKELVETVPNIFRYASAYRRERGLKSKGLWEMFVKKESEDELKERKKREAERAQKLKKVSKMPEKILKSDPEFSRLEEIAPYSMEGETYNMCHFWSNFEIANLDWFRSPEYNDFFNYLDRSGGFWMERWGDAPVHSLAAGALLGPEDVHYFRDFGYRHTTIQHCPPNAPLKQTKREKWLDETIADPRIRKQDDDYWEKWDKEMTNGSGCRCRCDTDIPEVEIKEGTCTPEWVEVMGGYLD